MITVINSKYTEYEQDIRELLQAFFPGETITGERTGEAFSRFPGSGARHPGNVQAAQARCEAYDGTGHLLDIDGMIPDTELTGSRFEDKTVIKRALYRVLSARTGKILPWGTLTGIKPVKLAERILGEGADRQNAASLLEERYLISTEKRDLMLDIALREKELLKPLSSGNGYSFYIGIPFCPTRCLYCSFTSNPVAKYEGRVEEYLDDLEKEAESFVRFLGSEKAAPSTLYVGGGTPTALTAPQMDRLLSMIERTVDISKLLEFTVESGRPDSITEDKLRVMRDHGVERISVNPQTMNQKTLDLIGRRHTVGQTAEAFELARKLGFSNINMDVIMGLPGENEEDVKHTLDVIEEMRPESLTVHSLAVKRAARLSTEHDPWTEYERAEGDEVSVMTAMGAETAEKLGMVPYYLYRQKNIAGNQENVGYAVPGKESLYNIIMMEEKQPVIGFGAGSTTKLGSLSAERMENVKDLSVYLDRIGEQIEKKRLFLENNRRFFGM